MPTYDYLCSKCEHAFEKFQSIMANPSKKCPECKKMSLVRLIGTGSGVIFKGSGFYETDYRSENYKQGQKDAKPKTETKDKKDTTEKQAKTESKSKAKTDKPKSPKGGK
ncbi:MAG TPA: zinc ribbon domain-containing protein [Phycisphaerales bacterium]|nr:zinc ribbon domain-containing protein [Phycisphaerales bacterium]